ncbi:MAG: nucleotide disphospho-sugar-binding domain-containing protein [Acidobacteriota bacterium]
MFHFAGISNVGRTHVRIMMAFGRELERRGHRFTMFQSRFVEELVTRAGISFFPLPDDDNQFAGLMQRMSGHAGVSFRTYPEYMRLSSRLLCRRGPEAFSASAVDFVLVDQEEPGGATAAEIAGIPFVTICSSLPLNQEAGIPPGFLPWQYRPEWWAKLRNRAAYKVRDFVIRPVFKEINRERRIHRLAPYSQPEDSFSRLAQISQLIPEFDLPRKSLPPRFSYVGPFLRQAEGPATPFPFDRLDGRPLIYVYYGGASAVKKTVIHQIAAACTSLDAQLVVALGEAGATMDLPGSPIVVDFAPQLQLLKMAKLVISHGGFSTTMEALGAGVPLLVIPFNGDQPGVGARVTHTGVGVSLPLASCNADALRSAIVRLLSSPEYRDRAGLMRQRITRTGGIGAAADLIEDCAGLPRA